MTEPRRLCIYSTKRQFSEARLFFLNLRSLRFIENTDHLLGIFQYLSDVSFIFHMFKLLKVLDLESINLFAYFPGEVEMLVHLRYFGISGPFEFIPQTIDKLWNLETFVVSGSYDGVSLPYTIFNMAKLRHVHISPNCIFSLPKENLEKFKEPCELMDTFSTPLISSMLDMTEIVRKLPNVRKLSCKWDKEKCCQLPSLNSLDQLESLKLISTCENTDQLEFNFPTKLKKLTLSKFCLQWAEISRISKLLPHLEVLKLENDACKGETWYMEEDEEFPKLQFLKLKKLNIVHWDASADNFPCLRKLVLEACSNLQGIPCGVTEIYSLEKIEVMWCHPSAASSAKEILQEKEELEVSVILLGSDEEDLFGVHF